MKYKLAIFENEKVEVEGVFNYINISDKFNGELECKYFARSQDISDLSLLSDFDLIIVDIDLSFFSELDGYGLIKQIESTINPTPNMLIMTGHEIQKGYNEAHNIKEHPFIKKPLNFVRVISKLNELL